jgi:hypothetical protein
MGTRIRAGGFVWRPFRARTAWTSSAISSGLGTYMRWLPGLGPPDSGRGSCVTLSENMIERCGKSGIILWPPRGPLRRFIHQDLTVTLCKG